MALRLKMFYNSCIEIKSARMKRNAVKRRRETAFCVCAKNSYRKEGKMIKRIPILLLLALALFLGAFGCRNAEPSPEQDGGKKPEEFNPTDLPYYVEDIENLQYSYTDEERIRPFWQGNVIHNEQLMIVKKDGVTKGRLLYEPARIISVRDWKLEKEYVEGEDYEIEGDTITLPEGSKIPVFCDEWSRGENVPSQYPLGNAGNGYQMVGTDGTVMYTESGLVWQNYIHVTYAYNPADVKRDMFSKYDGALYGLTEKIAGDSSDKNLKMVVFGDSISEGCSSSSKWNHAPMCPPYAELVKYGLETLGGLNVDFTNMSKGGEASGWAADADQLNRLSNLAPDFLILAFGTNDKGSDIEGGNYRKNIELVIETAKTVNAECQIILVAPFPSHEKSKTNAEHAQITATLKAIAAETPYMDVAFVSMFEPCVKMLEKKNYYEIAANNVNHPNDFIHRFYAMNILSAIFDYDAIASGK